MLNTFVKTAFAGRKAAKQRQTGRFHKAVPSVAQVFPRLTAKVFARRYLQSEHQILRDVRHSETPFEVIKCGAGYILRLDATDAQGTRRRCLIVPGHGGHYKQFLRLIRNLHKNQFSVDILAFPGHLGKKRETCSMRSIAQTVRTASKQHGIYHLLVAHCVSANAVLFELENGPLSARYAFISIPLKLQNLIRSGGELIGLAGKSLSYFIKQVDALGAPYQLDKDWYKVAESQSAPLLLLHSTNDFAAPFEDIAPLQRTWPAAQVTLYESGDHNGIVTSKRTVARLVTFALDEIDRIFA